MSELFTREQTDDGHLHCIVTNNSIVGRQVGEIKSDADHCVA